MLVVSKGFPPTSRGWIENAWRNLGLERCRQTICQTVSWLRSLSSSGTSRSMVENRWNGVAESLVKPMS